MGWYSRIIVWGLLATASLYAGLRITQSTSERFSFEWTLDTTDLSVSMRGDGTVLVSFPEANCDVGDRGDPALHGFSFMVGVPPDGDVSVSIVPKEVVSRSVEAPLTRWHDRRHDDGSAAPFFDNVWISRPIYGCIRGIRTVRLVIRPVFYDENTRSLSLLCRAAGSVVFPPSQPRGEPEAAASIGTQMMRSLLANYDVAARWKPPRVNAPRKVTAAEFPLSRGKALTFAIGDGHEGINEGTVNENGLIVIHGIDILPLGSSIPIANLALYGSYKGEMPEKLPLDLAHIPHGIQPIPLIRIDRGRVGYVDEADTFLAYVSGSSDWEFDTATPERRWKFSLNRFEDYRHYWIVPTGVAATVDTFDQPSLNLPDTLDACMSYRLYKRPTFLPSAWDGGLERIWKTLSVSAPIFDYPLGLLQPDSSAVGFIRYFGYNPPATHGPTAEINLSFTDGTPIATLCPPGRWQTVPALGSKAAVRFQAVGPPNALYELSSFEIQYRQKLDMRGLQELTIYSPDTIRLVTYRLSNVPSEGVWILRISPTESRISLIQPHMEGTTIVWSDTAGIGVRYYICSKSKVRAISRMEYVSPLGNTGYRISQLRSPTNRASYLIITEQSFLDAAERLAIHKERYGSFDNRVVRIVEIRDIYREFSGGNIDPAALRNFLAWANAFWAQPLEYVVFLGNGHWDYKNTQSAEPLFIPTFQADREQAQKCVDDYFACLDPGETWSGNPDIVLGRITCNTIAEANAIIDKIIDTEDPQKADFGPWRHRLLLVADDDHQGKEPDHIRDHHTSSETVAATIIRQNAAIDVRKVYLFEYPWDALWEKPEATRAMAAEVNNGVSIVNWFGHGSDVVWSDEHILSIDNINMFHNHPRYPLFSSFSCSVAKFDKPGHNSLSDALLKYAGGGAVACIAATRLAYATNNTNLAKDFFNRLFMYNNNASLGIAYRQAMTINGSSSKQYVFLGDPSIKYLSLSRRIKVAVVDRGGQESDSLQALSQVTVVCSVQTVEANPRLDSQFNGSLQISIFNPADTSYRKDGGSLFVTPYLLPGSPIFVGVSDLRAGVHHQVVLLPRNLIFDRPGAKVIAYGWQNNITALGVCDSLIFHGTDPNAVLLSDSSGPSISIRPIYSDPLRNAPASFSDRISVALPVSIGIKVYDESGLDVSSTSPDGGLTVEIPGVWSRRNINTKFRFNEGDFRSGEAAIALKENELAPGTYTIVVTAQDLIGNFSKRAFFLEVARKNQFKIEHAFNYPNPFRMGQGTRFFFYVTAPTYPFDDDGVRVVIKIYTLSGTLLRVLDSKGEGIANGIFWDGTDQLGNYLGPNVYLWRAFATHIFDGTNSRSGINKLVIHPPR